LFYIRKKERDTHHSDYSKQISSAYYQDIKTGDDDAVHRRQFMNDEADLEEMMNEREIDDMYEVFG
jgi:hypothetical protein